MKKITKELNIYILVTVLFSWILWILSMYYAIKNHLVLPYDDRIVGLFNIGFSSLLQEILFFIFTLGFFGPLLGYLVINKIFNLKKLLQFKIVERKTVAYYFLIPFIIFVLTLFLLFVLMLRSKIV